MIQFDTDKYVSIDISEDLLESTEEEGFTYLHCTYYASPKFSSGWWININKTTYLTSSASSDKLQMLNAIGVPLAPQKVFLKKLGDFIKFTLIFPAIPKDWKIFNLIEVAGGGGFNISNISRNNTGVYKVRIQ